jgi:heme/copper-type cytochrome/quinol oxidase subunit 4
MPEQNNPHRARWWIVAMFITVVVLALLVAGYFWIFRSTEKKPETPQTTVISRRMLDA